MTSSTTRLCLVDISKDIHFHAGLLNCFSLEQQAQLSGFSASRQKSYVLGRRLLLDILSKRYPGLSTQWEIIDRSDMPPEIIHPSKPEEISFSISHSGDWLGVAMHFNHYPKPDYLGVDIETTKPTRGIKAAAYFCNQQQLDDLAAIADSVEQLRQITRLWTQKEAYFKSNQKAVFNPDLKSLSIVDSAMQESLGYMNSATLDDQSELSMFSSQETSIDITSLVVDHRGGFMPGPTLNLHWQNSGVLLPKN